MTDSKNEKKDSWLSRLGKKSWSLVERFFESLKFKNDDLWYQKGLKILIRVISTLILIALSPLIITTIILIIALAS
ncbi:MAG: hypothetical protein ACPGVH_09735 [Chitinophagales bacterium]